MSGDQLTCLLCSHRGWDVRMTGVDRGDTAQEMQDVAIPVHTRSGTTGPRHGGSGPPELDYVRVPARFVREPRCENAKACSWRIAQAGTGNGS